MEESLPILPAEWELLEAPKEARQRPTTCSIEEALLAAYHESPWAGHRGTWATFKKQTEKYWWPGLYQDVHQFVTTCKRCQLHSAIWHRDESNPTYPPTFHFKWMVDLVTTPMGGG